MRKVIAKTVQFRNGTICTAPHRSRGKLMREYRVILSSPFVGLERETIMPEASMLLIWRGFEESFLYRFEVLNARPGWRQSRGVR